MKNLINIALLTLVASTSIVPFANAEQVTAAASGEITAVTNLDLSVGDAIEMDLNGYTDFSDFDKVDESKMATSGSLTNSIPLSSSGYEVCKAYADSKGLTLGPVKTDYSLIVMNDSSGITIAQASTSIPIGKFNIDAVGTSNIVCNLGYNIDLIDGKFGRGSASLSIMLHNTVSNFGVAKDKYGDDFTYGAGWATAEMSANMKVTNVNF